MPIHTANTSFVICCARSLFTSGKTFEKLLIAKNVLISNGIDKNLIDKNCLITSSCGCATLSVELTEKTFKLTKELSDKLKE